ncbi:hypothetical protein Taro_003509, partial [Colocasia esculenta]|nr:hypothetical protein [Colocasia esculenta]
VRAGIVGYPNVGKSSLINRLLKRRMCPAAPRPGVTRELKWVHFGKDLELLDSPGMLPMRISDQAAAIKLAICDDIGERSYDVADVAAILVQMLTKISSVGMCFMLWHSGSEAFYQRYRIDADPSCGKMYGFVCDLSSSIVSFLLSTSADDCIMVNFRFLEKLSLQLFNGDVSHAAFRVLSDFRKGKFGWVALERPPR